MVLRKSFISFVLVLSLPALARIKHDVSAEIKSISQSYYQDLNSQTDDFIKIFSGSLEYDVKFKKKLSFQSKLFTRFNTSSNSSMEETYVDLQEAFLRWKAYPYRIEIGNHIYNWGLLEAYSPVNVINQNALFDPLSPVPVGAPSIDLFYERDLFTLSLVYIPKQRKSHFPGTDSRWLPRKILVTGSEASQFKLPVIINYSYPRDNVLDDALDHNIGIRTSFRRNDWDIYLQHFEGASKNPSVQVFATSFGFELDSEIDLVPTYYRHRSTGLGLVWAPGEYIVRFESAYNQSISKDPSIDSWSSQNGLGLEKGFHIGNTSLTTILQLYYSDNPSKSDNLASSSYRLFDESALFSFLVSPSTETSYIFSALYSQPQDAYFYLLGFQTLVYKNTHLGMNSSSFDGDKDSLLGAFNKNDRFELNLKVDF